MRKSICLAAALAASAWAQTRIDLGAQSRNVDFSGAVSTRPVKTGTALPAVCSPGELFFQTSGPADRVLFACTAPNVWSAQGGGGAAVDYATQAEAEAGVEAAKSMSPERTMQAFRTWNPIPAQAGAAQALLRAGPSGLQWTYKLTVPPSGVQTIDNAGAAIVADRYTVQIAAPEQTTLVSAPTIYDGDDGQHACILNVGQGSVTMQDEGRLPGSGLRLNMPSLTLEPRESVCLVFSSIADAWIRANKDVNSAEALGDVSGPAGSADGRLAVFDGLTGKRLKEGPSGAGVMYANNGVPELIAGPPDHCVTVGGVPAPCQGYTRTVRRVSMPAPTGWTIESGGPTSNSEGGVTSYSFTGSTPPAGGVAARMRIPAEWTGAAPKAALLFRALTNVNGSDVAVFRVSMGCQAADGSAEISPASVSQWAAATVSLTAISGYRVRSLAIPSTAWAGTASCAPDSLMWVRVAREADNAVDTSSATVGVAQVDVDFEVGLQ